MNNVLKIFGVLAILVTPAWADDDVTFDDTRALTERTDCAAVANEIATINKTEDPDDDMLARLAELQTIQRRDCAKNTARRRAMGRGGKMANVIAAANATVNVTDDVTDSDVVADSGAVDSESITPVIEVDITSISCDELENQIDTLRATGDDTSDQMSKLTNEYDARCGATATSVETVAENLAAGLCADGTKPNRFGCCGDEKFTDMGDGVFGCCPPTDGADCFPPIVKGE